MLGHKKRHKEEKTAMDEEMENLRKVQAEAERESKNKDRERRAKPAATSLHARALQPI